ncbi:uncharacterized protein LOC104581574 [Brachypodium distachyon]|uniref:Uncharacterized protein n=1 Tax=Brachypodium distachyon TaxID=15368 RepID=A0A0Q3H665_BRADI|nr:uncharacterized protein LOC104581574 [Brachypodium distachyon]KQK18448.1 hypothetical protein BRADI_1g42540v3 [Brachypodium distachyon]|eukprot:XP_010227719.1 uncharacterized protein LOC104581574 [Brachypodium distachyon]
MSSYMHTHMYAAERAREFEVAARERQMGCSPLCGMLSKVVMKCNGRQGRTRKEKLDYAMAYPPVQTCYMRPPAASNHAIPVTAQFTPTPGAGAGAPPPRARGGKPRKRKKSKHVRFSPAGPGPALHPAGGPRPPAPPPHAAHAYQHAAGSTRSGGDQSLQQHASEPYYSRPASTPGDASGYYGSYGRYYAPSPSPRRHCEYFSGEYRWSYPTPVRQGIYSMATDANRLTAIFSEENPNACAIV